MYNFVVLCYLQYHNFIHPSQYKQQYYKTLAVCFVIENKELLMNIGTK